MQPLPPAWVDSLFARLAVRYGQEWLRKWEGLDIAAVKADWAEELAPLAQNPDAIKHGLSNLPERAPSVTQFRAICNLRPDIVKALPAPKADPERVREALAKLRPTKTQADSPKGWAWRLKAREESGERLTKAQRDMWRGALQAELQQHQEAA